MAALFLGLRLGVMLDQSRQEDYALKPKGMGFKVPTVIRFSRYRVVIYPNDHRPAHVHVIGPDAEAVFVLHCPDGPPELRESIGLSAPELNIIADRLGSELTTLCPAWRNIHHDY